jgi:hypothetical protein
MDMIVSMSSTPSSSIALPVEPTPVCMQTQQEVSEHEILALAQFVKLLIT